MRIAIVGSWKTENVDSWSLSDEAGFAEACRTVGAEIALQGHQLVVGSDSARTADYKAVEGVVQALRGSNVARPPIIVLRPDDASIPYRNFRNLYPRLFTSDSSPDTKWRITHLFQLQHAETLVVIGGAKLSYQAGVAAAVAGRRVVPVGSFGGAGKRLISLFQLSRGKWGSNLPTSDQLGSLHNPWSPLLADDLYRQIRLTEAPRILIIHGRSQDRESLKNYLQNRLGLPEPVIMAEQRTSGLTLPEKFERLASGVDGAIALVTPDDIGGFADSAKPEPELEARARQNVWLEAGWFWGRLGRNRFMLLVHGKPSIPSDLKGIEYFEYHSQPNERGDDIRGFIEHLRELT